MPERPITAMRRVVTLSTNIGQGCQHCDAFHGHGDTTGAANHYIEDHGYALLYVGPEWSQDDRGASIHHTVFVLGHDDPPAIKAPAEILFGDGLPPV